MTPVSRRRLQIGVLLVMLLLAAGSLVLAILGRGGWLGVGTALGIAATALSQLVTVTGSGERTGATTRGRVLTVGLSGATAAFLVAAGLADRSAFTWLIVGLFLVGLTLTTGGVLSRTRTRRPPPAPRPSSTSGSGAR